MKTLFTLLASVSLVASASAQFSVSSAGGTAIPSNAPAITGSNTGWDATGVDHDLAAHTAVAMPGTASVTVPAAVVCIDSVVVDGLEHTWMGDTMAVLRDPNNVGHVIWIRPGYGATSGFGNRGNFLVGTHTFVPVGTAGAAPLPMDVGAPGTDAAPGMWEQALDTGNGTTWPNGDEMIFNTGMAGITGPAGTWTLEIYDFAAGDPGNFTGFTLNGNSCGSSDVTFCDPNEANSVSATGTNLASGTGGTGSGLILMASDAPAGQFGYYLVGAASSDPGFFPPSSAGRLCLDFTSAVGRYNFGTTNSLGVIAPDGTFNYDVPSELPLPGSPMIMSGDTWNFQLWHREDAGSSNFSNGLTYTF